MKLIELGIRGRITPPEEKQLLDLSQSLLEGSASLRDVSYDDKHCTKMVNMAVVLHNKVRNMVTTEVSKHAKAVLRAAAAFILRFYGQPTTKVLCTCIKLHSRAAHELQGLADTEIWIEKCIDEAISAWEQINMSSAEKVS